MTEEQERFLDGDLDDFVDEVNGDPVSIFAEETVTCGCDWGGWHWQAEDSTRQGALRRLRTKLTTLDPFFGADTDHGDPGYQIGELSSQIPLEMRTRMRQLSDDEGENHPDDNEARARDES